VNEKPTTPPFQDGKAVSEKSTTPLPAQGGQTKKVALLATGDEVLNGDITDGNGQFISQTLFNHHITNGLHLICSDEQTELERSIRFLLEHHDALITTGGLGPTSDDRTRFALSAVTERPLIFDENTWTYIVERAKARGYTFPDNNRQQALFPENAKIIRNANGSAAACEFEHNGKLIFMLPGPPGECLPIFEQHVLTTLLAHNFVQNIFRKKWCVQGIGESALAAQLDPLAELHQFTIGYRVIKPIIEVKIVSTDKKVFEDAVNAVEKIVKAFVVI